MTSCINGLYEHKGAYMSQCVDVERAREAKLLMVAPPKEAVLLVASPIRRTSTEAVRKLTSCYIS